MNYLKVWENLPCICSLDESLHHQPHSHDHWFLSQLIFHQFYLVQINQCVHHLDQRVHEENSWQMFLRCHHQQQLGNEDLELGLSQYLTFFQPPTSAKLRTLLPLYALMTWTGTTSIFFSLFLLPYRYVLESLPVHDSWWCFVKEAWPTHTWLQNAFIFKGMEWLWIHYNC